jgi:hypothetical protein
MIVRVEIGEFSDGEGVRGSIPCWSAIAVEFLVIVGMETNDFSGGERVRGTIPGLFVTSVEFLVIVEVIRFPDGEGMKGTTAGLLVRSVEFFVVDGIDVMLSGLNEGIISGSSDITEIMDVSVDLRAVDGESCFEVTVGALSTAGMMLINDSRAILDVVAT